MFSIYNILFYNHLIMDEYPNVRNKPYILGICQLYNPAIHGTNDIEIYSQFIYLFELSNIFGYSYSRIQEHYQSIVRSYYRNARVLKHPLIRNYVNIMNHPYFINPDIIQVINITDSEGYVIYCCIKKTFWLRIIQRTWKNVLKKRKELLQKRKSIYNLYYKEINGKWPDGCNIYPSLRGMLR